MAIGRNLALAAVLVIVPAASATAQDDAESSGSPYARNGFYVGVAGSLGISNFKESLEDEINDDLAALGTVDIGLTVADQEPQGVPISRPVPVNFSGVKAGLDGGPSIGVNARVGYRFHPNFSAEVQAEWLNPFEYNVHADDLVREIPALNIPFNPPPGGTPPREGELNYIKFATTKVAPWVVTGNVRGHLLTGAFQPFLLVGVGVMTAEVELKVKDSVGEGSKGRDFRKRVSRSDRLTGFAARLGGGVEIYANEHFVFTLGLDYVLPAGDVKDLDYISFGWGVQYRF